MRWRNGYQISARELKLILNVSSIFMRVISRDQSGGTITYCYWPLSNSDQQGCDRFRLEKVMMEQALSYYKDAAQRLKKEKERMSKNAVGYKDYYVRYCFKIAFYTEFIKDTRVSIK